MGDNNGQVKSFVKLCRGENTNELMKDPPCFMLLCQIAIRARRTNNFNLDDLVPGEAKLGDPQNIGLTQSQYRTAKKKLEKWKIATFRPTNRGTIAKLINYSIFDPNIETDDNPNDNQESYKKHARGNQIASNKNYNKEKNENNNKALSLCLIDVGVKPVTANLVVSKNCAEYIMRKIAEYRFLEQSNPDRVSKNGPGFLVKSIKENYAPPPGFEDWFKRNNYNGGSIMGSNNINKMLNDLVGSMKVS